MKTNNTKFCPSIILIIIINIILFFSFLIFPNQLVFAQTYVSGDVSGTWAFAKSPYYVTNGDITIQNGDTLTIEPGVEVIFNIGGFEFKVSGTLIAKGLADSVITFMGILNNQGIWRGIYFNHDESSKLEYCIIRDAGFHNQAALHYYESKSSIKHCNILNNGGDGIECRYSTSEINSNVIINNGNFGINRSTRYYGQELLVRFNLVWNNTNGNFDRYLAQDLGSNIMVNVNGDSCDSYLNISSDPLFIDLEGGDFHLTKESPCIDAGDLTLCDPDGSIADIGAYYYDKTTHVNYTNNLIKPNLFMLSQNYPNPFNSETTISYIIPKPTFVSIKIFDINGKEIETLVTEYHSAGNFKVKFNAKSLPSGLYFYSLISGDFIKTRKFILTK